MVNFTGAAALWLEWSHAHIKSTNWDQFVGSVLDKFGRSEFQQLLRKFSRLKQQGSVLEYAQHFNVAMHSLLAHHSSWDPLFFTMHFMDGLHHGMKVAVMLHCPKDLETAVALAELQEEVIDMIRQDQEAAAGQKGKSPSSKGCRFTTRPPLPVVVPSAGVLSKGSPSSAGLGGTDGRAVQIMHGSPLPIRQWTTSSAHYEPTARHTCFVSLVATVGVLAMFVRPRRHYMSWRNSWVC